MKYLILFCLLLSACAPNRHYYSNEEIIAQVRICHAAGMDYEIMVDIFGDIVTVRCVKAKP